MFALLVKLHAAARELHKPESRMARRKLARAIQNQVEPAAGRLHLKRLLHPDYRNSGPAQDFHDTRVAGHLGTRIRGIGTRALMARIQACHTHDEIRTARDKRAVLQERVPKDRCRHQYTESPKWPRTRPFMGQG